MQATAITSEGLARPQVGPLAGPSKGLVVSETPWPDTSALPRPAASRTASCSRERRLDLSQNGARTMDAAEHWVYAVLWLCCLFSLLYCFATLL